MDLHHSFTLPSYTGDSQENEHYMQTEHPELDEMQAKYKAAVDAWVAAIRREEALASVADHSVADIDAWEEADEDEEEAREKAKEAKQAYEDALREKFFHF
jgi:hypothetical protein